MPIAPDLFATHLARAVDLFRDPTRKEDQKRAFRVLVGMLQEEGATVRADDHRVSVNGQPVKTSDVIPLLQRLELHGVSELSIPRDAPVSHVFELLKALADQPGGTEDIDARLRASGAYRVSVSITKLTPFPATPVPTPPSPMPPPARPSMGTGGILRGDPLHDIAPPAVPVGGAGAGDVHQVTPTPEAPVAPAEPIATPIQDLHVETHEAPPPAPQPTPPPAEPVKPAARPSQPEVARAAASEIFAPAAARSQGAIDVLKELAANPQSATVGDTLAVLTRQVEAAIKANKIEQVLHLMAGLIKVEQGVPDGSARRHYGIALKRMFSRQVLEALAQLATMPVHVADAMIVLQRAGEDGVEVLLDLLIGAPSVNERRHVFDALTQIKQGSDQIIHLLGHHQWFVVRNVAELAGEKGLEDAIPGLSKALSHEDERVRKAVAMALAKIGTPKVAEPLRRALRDKSKDVRIQTALGVGGRKASPLAMPLVVAMEEEEDVEVQRELVLALGRIASPDAVQAVIKIAVPSGKLFGRKPTGLRLAAVEALRLAATPAAAGTLQTLAGDSDKQVKAAAQSALEEVRRKG